MKGRPSGEKCMDHITERKKLKKKISIIAVLTAAALLAALLLFAVFNYHTLYVFSERHGLFCSKIRISEVTPELEYFVYGDTLGGRVRYTEDLMLVNREYPLPDEYETNITEYKDTDVYMNGEGMLSAYARLSSAVTERTGEKLYVSSDYRDAEAQTALYLEDPDTATAPGTSEHQTGLALDVYVAYYSGDGFLKSPSGRFVNSHAHEYGFIIRYPSYGEETTGIRYEPWHIRYVGAVHADIIYNNHTTLEEHVLSMQIGQWYEADGHMYSRQYLDGNRALPMPKGCQSVTISPDNTGAYVITVN